MDKRQVAHFKAFRLLAILFVLLLAAAVMQAQPCQAGMQELADTELSDVHAAGFSTFDLDPTTGIARMDLNTVTVSTYTEIASLKMGYYNNVTTLGWDQDWSNVSIGSDTTSLVCRGFYIEAKFTNYNDPLTRQLEYVRIGTPHLTGQVSAVFASLSGDISGASQVRLPLGGGLRSTIESPNPDNPDPAAARGFYLSLDRMNGFQVHWDNAKVTTP